MSAQIHTNRKTKILINRYVRFDWINRYLWYWLPFIKSSLKAMISSNKSIASDKCVVVIRKNKPIIGMWVPIKTCKVRKQHHHLKGLTTKYLLYSHSNPQQNHCLRITCHFHETFQFFDHVLFTKSYPPKIFIEWWITKPWKANCVSFDWKWWLAKVMLQKTFHYLICPRKISYFWTWKDFSQVVKCRLAKLQQVPLLV